MKTFDRDQLPKWEFHPAEPAPPGDSPTNSEGSPSAVNDACCMQDGENPETVASQNETRASKESQPVAQQEDTATISEEAKKFMQHLFPEEGVADTKPQKRKRKKRDESERILADQKWTVLRALRRGASMRAAAAYSGCHPSTVSRWIQQDEQFAARVTCHQEDLREELIRELRRAAGKDWRAAMRLLEYLDKRTQSKENVPSTQV